MDRSAYESLTDRERDCLRLFARLTAKEIAPRLGISAGTVETHLRRARAKLGGPSASNAAYQLLDYETAVSRPAGTQPSGRAFDATTSERGDASHGVGEVREERSAFHGPRRDQTFVDGGKTWESHRSGPDYLRRAALIAIVFLVGVLGIIAAPPLGDSFQRLANLLDPWP